MKRSVMVICLVFLAFFHASAQDTWVWQNPLPQGNILNDVFLVEPNTVFAVGGEGTVLKSIDGGAHWEFVTIEVYDAWEERNVRWDQNCRSVFFLDANTGWIVGDGSSILKTTDGGESWTFQVPPSGHDPQDPWAFPDIYDLYSVYFLDANTGWSVGEKSVEENLSFVSYGGILKTTDGGATWIDQPSGIENWLKDVYVIDANTAWAAGGSWDDAQLLYTNDGGANWNLHPGMPAYSNDAINLQSVWFASQNNGWVVGGDDLTLATTDGGTTWSVFDWAPFTGTYTQPRSVYFSDAAHGWVVGHYILYTADGGATWTQQGEELSGFDHYRSIHSRGNDQAFIAGTGSRILHTTDAGAEWSGSSSGATGNLYDVDFIDAATGWAVGDGGTVLATNNGGSSWVVQPTGIPLAEDADFKSSHFVDASTGWVAGYQWDSDSPILKTEDGGSSWSSQASGTRNTLEGIHFADALNGWAVGEGGVILHTTDGGGGWSPQTSPTTHRLQSVFAVDASTAWAVGGAFMEGTVLMTTDGGATWTPKDAGASDWLYDVFFLDANFGWIVGYETVLTTTDGGVSWSPQDLPDWGFSLLSVHFGNTLHGYAVGGSGDVLRTGDGGCTWEVESCGTNYSLRGVHVSGTNSAWIAGDGGSILYRGEPTPVEDWMADDSALPSAFALEQNYPNPFNPVTTIRFHLPVTTRASLKIYSLTGALVETLREGSMAAGKHEIRWNAAHLPSGIYFFRLEADSFARTNKLILQK